MGPVGGPHPQGGIQPTPSTFLRVKSVTCTQKDTFPPLPQPALSTVTQVTDPWRQVQPPFYRWGN